MAYLEYRAYVEVDGHFPYINDKKKNNNSWYLEHGYLEYPAYVEVFSRSRALFHPVYLEVQSIFQSAYHTWPTQVTHSHPWQ